MRPVHVVAETLERRALWSADDRIAVALSGGGDSVALTFVLLDLLGGASDIARSPDRPSPMAGRLAGLIHVNHTLRGAESDADEAFCRALAARLQLPIDVSRVDVAERMRECSESTETAARVLRYEAFEAAAARLGATIVATGHTLDDQAETVLLRLLRGATVRGVSAIRARRGMIVRPLLDCRRHDLRQDLAVRGEPYREDASNLDERIPRNRLRRDVMPALAAFAPAGMRALARFAELAAEDERFLSEAAIVEAGSIVLHAEALRAETQSDAETQGDAGRTGVRGVQLERKALATLPRAVSRRIMRDAAERLGAPVSARSLARIDRLIRADNPVGRLHLPGLEVERVEDRIHITDSSRGPAETGQFAYRLTVPGTVQISETCDVITASYQEEMDAGTALASGRGSTAAVQADSLSVPLTVRNRRPGDRMRPLGAPGHRKLQDLFVDRKIPRAERDRVPVIVDTQDRIVWVVGVAIAEECRVSAPEGRVVIFQVTKGIK